MKTKKQNNKNYTVYFTIFNVKGIKYVYVGSGDRYEPTRRTWQFNHGILTNDKIKKLNGNYWGVETHTLLNTKTKKLAEGIEIELIGLLNGSKRNLNMNGSTKLHRGRNTKIIRRTVEEIIDIIMTGAFFEDYKTFAEVFFESQSNYLNELEK